MVTSIPPGGDRPPTTSSTSWRRIRPARSKRKCEGVRRLAARAGGRSGHVPSSECRLLRPRPPHGRRRRLRAWAGAPRPGGRRLRMPGSGGSGGAPGAHCPAPPRLDGGAGPALSRSIGGSRRKTVQIRGMTLTLGSGDYRSLSWRHHPCSSRSPPNSATHVAPTAPRCLTRDDRSNSSVTRDLPIWSGQGLPCPVAVRDAPRSDRAPPADAPTTARPTANDG